MGKGSKSKKKDIQAEFNEEYSDWQPELPEKVEPPSNGWNWIYMGEKFRVKQAVNLLEALSGGICEFENKYAVKAKFAKEGKDKEKWHKVYKAKEESACLERCCCAPNHKFSIQIDDKDDNAILALYHPMKCAPCCCVCCNMCQHEMFIYHSATEAGKHHPAFSQDHEDRPCCAAPTDARGLAAIIRQPVCGGVYRPTVQAFSVQQADTLEAVQELWTENKDDPGYAGSMDIVGPYLCIGSFCDSTFQAQPPGQFGDENTRGMYGKIVKEGAEDAEDVARELCSDADNFTIKFEKDRTGWTEDQWNDKMWNKAKLLSALFLLDYMFFEQEGAFECCPEPGIICRIKCCDLYCCGALIPCYCTLAQGGEDGGGD
jgi:hypothetical protein